MTVFLLPPPPGLETVVQAIAVRRRRRADLPGGRAVRAQSFAANAYTVLTFCHLGALRDPVNGRRLQPFEITGPMSAPVWRSYEEQPEVTTVFLRPGAASWLLRHSAAEFAQRSEDASPLLPPGAARSLVERLAEARTTSEQVHLVETLLRQLSASARDHRRSPPPLPVIEPAHLLSVNDLARRLELGPRQLQRRALSDWGLAPKQMLRVQRMQAGVRDLRHWAQRSRAAPDWDHLAHSWGYADRPHMRREFKALAGVTPATILSDYRSQQPHYWDFEP